jgi:hypothetical protein
MLGQGPAYGWVDGSFAEVMQNLILREIYYIHSFRSDWGGCTENPQST